MKTTIGIYFVAMLLYSNLFATSKFLLNSGIIDIGHKQENNETQVPKEKIISDPSMQITENRITYQKRIQSEKFDCESDFLGTETCPQEKSICPSSEQYQDGYSILNHVKKNFIKQCVFGTIENNGRCYLDTNGDAIKDIFTLTKEYRLLWSGKVKNTTKTLTETLDIPTYGSLFVQSYGAGVCDNDGSYFSISNEGTKEVYGHCYKGNMQGAYTHSPVNTGIVEIFKNDTNSSAEITLTYSYTNYNGGHDYSTMKRWIYKWDKPFPAGWTKDDSNPDVLTFYKEPSCPFGSTEIADGTCAVEYNWYSYLCPSDLNEYGSPWQVIDAGSDCGNATCVNSATPPVNNCIRLNYTCPLNPNQKCGKTLNSVESCDDGYVWNNNRCERIDSYCGSSFYNAALDVCQNITRYIKLCGNTDEIYNSKTDKCETGLVACDNGSYESNINACAMDFVASCLSTGYSYNSASDICENPTEKVCETQYNFDGTLCIGEMAMCATGQVYNETLKKCETSRICGINETIDGGTQCETPSQCDGVISNGKCIPNTVQ
jgi:hypothetical protein